MYPGPINFNSQEGEENMISLNFNQTMGYNAIIQKSIAIDQFCENQKYKKLFQILVSKYEGNIAPCQFFLNICKLKIYNLN